MTLTMPPPDAVNAFRSVSPVLSRWLSARFQSTEIRLRPSSAVEVARDCRIELSLTRESASCLASFPGCSIAVAQADLDAHRIAQRDRGLAGEIDVRLALPTDDDADPRYLRFGRGDGAR